LKDPAQSGPSLRLQNRLEFGPTLRHGGRALFENDQVLAFNGSTEGRQEIAGMQDTGQQYEGR
jgi:hypothetical protein